MLYSYRKTFERTLKMAVKVGLKYIEIWNESMEDTIQAYEREEQHKGEIVFYGPSYFTRWGKRHGMVPMRDVLLGKSGKPCVVNRGFGSSCAEHQLYYYPRLIRPLEPKVLVYSFLANGKSFGYSTEETWELAQRVIAYARTDFPDVTIYLCGPQPHREEPNFSANEENKRFSAIIKAFAENTPNCHYIDVWKYEELHRKDIFVEDGIHYNQAGYHLYGKVFKKELKAELDKF